MFQKVSCSSPKNQKKQQWIQLAENVLRDTPKVLSHIAAGRLSWETRTFRALQIFEKKINSWKQCRKHGIRWGSILMTLIL